MYPSRATYKTSVVYLKTCLAGDLQVLLQFRPLHYIYLSLQIRDTWRGASLGIWVCGRAVYGSGSTRTGKGTLQESLYPSCPVNPRVTFISVPVPEHGLPAIPAGTRGNPSFFWLSEKQILPIGIMASIKKTKPNSRPPAGQPSLLDRGISSEVYPAPVPPIHPNFVEACNNMLVGQKVFVRGDYWLGAKESEKRVLYECEVLR